MHSFPSPVEPVLTLVKYRYLIRQLVKKELTTKFRRSSLGFLWIVLSPLLLLGDSRLKRIGEERLRVPAGAFDTTHFEILLVDFPALHFWVTARDVQLVRIEWQHLDAYYELLEYEETESAASI